MFFRQIQQHGDNFSYIIADETTHEAAVVDSSYNAGAIAHILKTESFTLKYIINTHGHTDHTAGNHELNAAFKAKIAAHKQSITNPDLKLDDGDTLTIGSLHLNVIYTPGHTPDSICLLIDDKILLTGDTLFVGECGRTDFSGGNSRSLYDSLFNKLLKLTDNIEVYPGHDYGKTPHSTIGAERRTNYVLQPRTVDEFVAFMNQP